MYSGGLRFCSFVSGGKSLVSRWLRSAFALPKVVSWVWKTCWRVDRANWDIPARGVWRDALAGGRYHRPSMYRQRRGNTGAFEEEPEWLKGLGGPSVISAELLPLLERLARRSMNTQAALDQAGETEKPKSRTAVPPDSSWGGPGPHRTELGRNRGLCFSGPPTCVGLNHLPQFATCPVAGVWTILSEFRIRRNLSGAPAESKPAGLAASCTLRSKLARNRGKCAVECRAKPAEDDATAVSKKSGYLLTVK